MEGFVEDGGIVGGRLILEKKKTLGVALKLCILSCELEIYTDIS